MPLERKEVETTPRRSTSICFCDLTASRKKRVAILKSRRVTHGILQQQSTVMAGSTFSGEPGLGSAPIPIAYQLCDLEQVTHALCVSFSSSVKWVL